MLRFKTIFAAAVGALILASCSSAPTATQKATVDPNAVTECDERAAHPRDPRKISPGRSTRDIDLPKAVAACREAVANQPDNARLNYQLGRVLTYSGAMDEALPYLTKAADADYPQAQFVVGYLNVTGNLIPQDLCHAAERYLAAAKLGRQAALVAYPRHALRGDFDDCGTPSDPETLGAMLKQADEASSDYYQGLLIQMLTDRLASR